MSFQSAKTNTKNISILSHIFGKYQIIADKEETLKASRESTFFQKS